MHWCLQWLWRWLPFLRLWVPLSPLYRPWEPRRWPGNMPLSKIWKQWKVLDVYQLSVQIKPEHWHRIRWRFSRFILIIRPWELMHWIWSSSLIDICSTMRFWLMILLLWRDRVSVIQQKWHFWKWEEKRTSKRIFWKRWCRAWRRYHLIQTENWWAQSIACMVCRPFWLRAPWIFCWSERTESVSGMKSVRSLSRT